MRCVRAYQRRCFCRFAVARRKYVSVIFFFQAEDGIRDRTVTGVQTCALPICLRPHEGFVLMPNTVEAYRVGPKAFEYKGTNGFMITWDMNSKDVAPPAPGK